MVLGQSEEPAGQGAASSFRNMIKKLGMSLARAARFLGVSIPTISKILRSIALENCD